MRIIAGTLKSRRLATPDFAGLRPTSDKLRETLFNVIAPRVPDSNLLDGFAGTGALGIEALSRGAASVTFVDEDPRAIALIGENVRRCGIAERCVIIRGRFAEVTRRLTPASFDLILLDPPYAASGAGRTGSPRASPGSNDDSRDNERELSAVLETAAGLLRDEGLVVLEHARRYEAPASAGPLTRTRSLVSGDSALAFYERAPNERRD